MTFLFTSLCLFGCSEEAPTNRDFTEYSRSVEDLALFVNLDGLEIEDVYWTSGPIIRDAVEESFLPNSNDWWLNAIITFSNKQNIEAITKGCELSNSVTENDTSFISDSVKSLTNNPAFTKAPLEVFDACRFKSGVLASGQLVKDVETNQVILKLATN
ncbi:hypothetical protein [Agarivorans sp. 1_MG-2023]|uniref:hypothetical protein n=1 Tax=Agarivorans sp. 1_MG-2023 TaxID=3062634 RepID=UPI0026E3762A|nr:hypothetical protein [Agarivorans sp. 1_MG-2023]